MTYSLDFRRHVLSVREKEGLTFAETATRFSVGVASLTRWAKSPEPKATREGRPRKVDLEKLAQDVRDHPDAYQYERAARFQVTPKAIWNGLRALGVTYEKIADAPEVGRSRAASPPREDCARSE
ncbi:IS630 transposase-related protein [Paracoccus sp. (in: a-proteobacteria)]|uniref:IS630 transposase-related protein n=1 Tax=Paracoccus sp. TaxID=267 RepID=UPI003A8512A7